MIASAPWAVILGAALGLGLWTLVSITPRIGAPRLSDRVAPYVVDVSEEARVLVDRPSGDPLLVIWRLLNPIVGRFVGAFSLVLSTNETVALRLAQRGSSLDVSSFRRRELLCALAGFAVGGLPAVATLLAGAFPPVVLGALPLIGALAGAFGCEWELSRAAKARVARLEQELPTVLGFLSLSLSAGEGILDSMRRVAAVSSGEFSVEFRRVVSDVGSGTPLSRALIELSERIRVPALTRTVEQLTGALERGSPLAETLRAQASDARVEGKRRLLESAGKKEVAMLVPLVFLILPLSVAFAVLPGLLVLRTGF
ncbi:type II secretion system F family protein [Labedella endophytica]|uniref:Type II secretion system F family protein n=1 Tax=Labedella endophytica TaxID=1523160 RepID=A0A3S0VDS3_9MICO|nr:type II secretion system F family protein [Labedella endophytica]RUQ97655.1 type II secretion system F family protein [Labedella endophytica]